jgi:hypothetical protein
MSVAYSSSISSNYSCKKVDGSVVALSKMFELITNTELSKMFELRTNKYMHALDRISN